MLDKTLQDAVNGFIQQRIDDHGIMPNDGLQEAYQEFEKRLGALKEVLTPDQTGILLTFEDAYSLVDGETMNSYYRAGFTDAVLFLSGWRDGEWK